MVNNLYVVTPRGFCAGVEMAIKALTWMLKIYDETIYCYHEIVHNDWIVKKFKENNVKFVNHPDELPDNAIVMLSAHGTAPNIEKEFKFKNFLESQKFVNNIGNIAENEGHHPDINFGWGYARIKIYTHAIKGLAESDFILAAKIDKI